MKVKLDLKRTLKLGKPRVPEVLVGQYGLVGWDSPVDSQAFIQNRNAAIRLWVVELIALVLEDGRFGEDGKAMGETSGNKELAMVIFGQCHCDMLAKCR